MLNFPAERSTLVAHQLAHLHVVPSGHRRSQPARNDLRPSVGEEEADRLHRSTLKRAFFLPPPWEKPSKSLGKRVVAAAPHPKDMLTGHSNAVWRRQKLPGRRKPKFVSHRNDGRLFPLSSAQAPGNA